MTKRIRPRRGEVYTLRQIYTLLELRDSPHLGFYFNAPLADGTVDKRPNAMRIPCVVQESHVTDAQLLALPSGFADTLWEYERETHEWIPVFKWANTDRPITDFVTMEVERGPYDDEPSWWVTPKGCPREQFYGPDTPPAPWTFPDSEWAISQREREESLSQPRKAV